MGSSGDVGCKSPQTLQIFASASGFISSLTLQDSPALPRWGNAMHPSQVEFGILFVLLVTGLFPIDF